MKSMNSDLVECCPECGHTDIYQRQPGKFRDSENKPEKLYWCDRCKTGFDDPSKKIRGDNSNLPHRLGVSDDDIEAAREALGIGVDSNE